MKMISSTSMTSIKGVTLISWLTARSPSASSIFMAIGLARDRGAAIEIAAGHAQDEGRGVAEQATVAGNDARESVVDDAGRDRGDQAERGGEQSLGDAGRHHHEVGSLRLRDADETRHDSPHRAEQPDERRARSD